MSTRSRQVERELDGQAFDDCVESGEQVVECDLFLLGEPVRLTRGRWPWLALRVTKRFSTIFYRRDLLTPNVAFSVAQELLIAGDLQWADTGRREFITTVSGARTLKREVDRMKYPGNLVARPIVPDDKPLTGSGRLS